MHGGKSLLVVGASTALLLLLMRRRRRASTTDTGKPLPTDIQRATTVDEAVALIRSEGVCIMERVLDEARLATLRARLAQIEPRKMQNRRAHRWEHVHSPDDPPLAELAAHETLLPVVRALLGPKHYLEKAGLVVSHSGADAQRWHMDTPHLFACGTHLPPHSLSVFVPLCELHPANGPTEYQLATHLKANLVLKPRYALASCPPGSLVMYDLRIMHRGGPNQSDAERPLVYLTISRICYRETKAARKVPRAV